MRKLMVLVALLVAMSGCATASGTPSAAATFDQVRPSSPAKVWIIQPTSGEVIHGSTLTVVIGLSGAQMSPSITTHISPTLGHVHLFIDSALTYMNYKLTTKIHITPGSTYSMRAEFVAQDHLPFNPPVMTKTIFFSVVSGS